MRSCFGAALPTHGRAIGCAQQTFAWRSLCATDGLVVRVMVGAGGAGEVRAVLQGGTLALTPVTAACLACYLKVLGQA